MNPAYDFTGQAALDRSTQATGNTRNAGTAPTGAVFGLTDPTVAQGTRAPAGALPPTTFLARTNNFGATMREP
jgi:hypothetical protein